MQDTKTEFKNEFKKRCFKFSIAILNLSEKLKHNKINLPLLDQLVRSGTSIGANVVEGGNSESRKEFVHYFNISLKSASETIYWLELIHEVNPGSKAEIVQITQECTELKRLLTKIILNTKAS